MTIPSDVNRSGPYTGDGVAKAFDYKFKIYDAADVQVIVTDLVGVDSTLRLNVDYTVTGVGNDGGGQVSLTAPLSAGLLLVNLLNVAFTQDIDLENQGAYYAETVERGFDLSVMRDQQLEERLNRAVTIPPSASVDQLDTLIADIIRLGGSVDQVNTVAAIRDQVVTVAAIAGQVVTVASIAQQVATVAASNAAVSSVAADIPTINAVYADRVNIDTVAAGMGDVNKVAADIASVKTLAPDLANVDAVVANKANIDTVAGINGKVTTVAGIAANVTTVAGMVANVAAIVSDKANIDAVGGNIGNVNIVAANNNGVTTVAGIASQVQTVAANVASAKNFGDVYQGAKAAAPTKRNDGTNLQSGDMYFSTTDNQLYTYGSNGWVSGGTTVTAAELTNDAAGLAAILAKLNGQPAIGYTPVNKAGDTITGELDVTGVIKATQQVYSGAAYLNTNGNVYGTAWSSWGASDAFSAISARIEARCLAFINAYAVTQSQMAGYVSYTHPTGTTTFTTSAYVITMTERVSGDQYAFGARQPQLYVPNRGWFAAFVF